MQRRGHKQLVIICLVICLILLCPMSSWGNNYYYIDSYETNSDNTGILLAKINLEAKSIEWSTPIPITGGIVFKTPLSIKRGGQNFLVVSTFNGLWGKNSTNASGISTSYAIFDENGVQLGIDSLPSGVGILDFHYGPTYSDTTLRYTTNRDVEYLGFPTLSNDNVLRLSRNREYRFRDSDYPIIGGFRYFRRISGRNNSLYWDEKDNWVHLLTINFDNRTLIDSLNIGYVTDYSYLFALSADDSLIYSFSINWNYLSGPVETQKEIINPSYLKIFSAANLSIIDSISIPYPSLEIGYANREIGNCDCVGPYLVYYFFEQEAAAIFSPAMLFIFDTRTNETTWLRVGWR